VIDPPHLLVVVGLAIRGAGFVRRHLPLLAVPMISTVKVVKLLSVSRRRRARFLSALAFANAFGGGDRIGKFSAIFSFICQFFGRLQGGFGFSVLNLSDYFFKLRTRAVFRPICFCSLLFSRPAVLPDSLGAIKLMSVIISML
jgi:hypothetical protein